MRVVVEPVDHLRDVFIDERVIGDVVGPLLQLRLVWELTVEQEIRYFEISALLCELIDRITAILEDSLVTIDKSDATFARSGIHERRVVSHEAEVVVRDFDL